MKTLEKALRRTPTGMFVTSHAAHTSEIANALSGLSFQHILIVRDPRDLVISHFNFVMRETWHPLHDHYLRELTNDHDRLLTSIVGCRPTGTSGFRLPSIGERFEAYRGWLSRPDVHVLRFEDLLPPTAGGSDQRRILTIQRVADFVGRTCSADQALEIGDRMYGKRTLTFRRGISGEWRGKFSAAHYDAFLTNAAEVACDFGYNIENGS